MNKVIVTRCVVGICHMQVCAVASATNKEILKVCNMENPSGVSPWGKVIRKKTKSDPGPVKCADDSKRKHFLVSC